MLQCTMCGKCCLAIGLTKTLDELSELKYREIDLLLSIWTPISIEEAYEINPYVKNIKGYKHFFKCSAYNQTAKQCEIYENRPFICKNYPFLYNGKPLDKEIYYGEKCGFKPKIK